MWDEFGAVWLDVVEVLLADFHVLLKVVVGAVVVGDDFNPSEARVDFKVPAFFGVEGAFIVVDFSEAHVLEGDTISFEELLRARQVIGDKLAADDVVFGELFGADGLYFVFADAENADVV